ncbi:MAG: dCMP deaminase family protein [Paludibacteraceae bacterium]|nr:dCMP deaminase family protein [Paludibacteraceae bacterium]
MGKGRISWDEYFLNVAREVSKRSTCIKRQYGAVIVDRNKTIVSTGYNGSPRGEVNCCDIGYCERLHVPHNSGQYDSCRSVHAEQNAIISASRSDMLGATLYLYGEENGKPIDATPCPICDRLIKNAGISQVVCSRPE